MCVCGGGGGGGDLSLSLSLSQMTELENDCQHCVVSFTDLVCCFSQGMIVKTAQFQSWDACENCAVLVMA